MSGTLSPTPKFTGFDDFGIILPGGKLWTYDAGTTDLADTFTDVDLLVPNTNPIILDSAGRAVIYLSPKSYKFILRDANDALVWSQDNIPATGVSAGGGSVAEAFFFGGDPDSPITDTAYPVGATYDKLHAGTSIYQVDSALLAPGTYGIQAMLKASPSQSVTIGIVDLDDGSPDTPLATITSNNTIGALVTSSAITFAAGGVVKNYGIKGRVTAESGYAWTIRLVKLT